MENSGTRVVARLFFFCCLCVVSKQQAGYDSALHSLEGHRLALQSPFDLISLSFLVAVAGVVFLNVKGKLFDPVVFERLIRVRKEREGRE